MCEEEKEKPDWLSDLQNNQKPEERENIEIRFDVNNPVLAYASPRYGRRSIPGTKSVNNSPTKVSSNENKSNSVRSNSARPLTVRDEFISKVNEKENAFNKSLDILRDDFEKLSLHNSLQAKPQLHRRHLNSKKSNESWKVSRDSLEVSNVAQEKISPENVVVKKQSNTFQTESRPRHKEGNNVFKANLRNKHNFGDSRRADAPDKRQKSTQEFIIPELPKGKRLIINVKTTWGDKHFLGLNGIEMFNSKGIKPQIKSISTSLDNINLTKNPRYIENLIDNINLTQDDMHMWMAPYTANSDHIICIEFDKVEELAMLRIWNYNKSRIHCYRGVKDIEIKLDDEYIFFGEIAMASGEILSTLNSFGDTILFTTDENILESVGENDAYFNGNVFSTLENTLSIEEMRPLTGGNGSFSRKPKQDLSENQIAFSEKKFDAVTEGTNLKTLTEHYKNDSDKDSREESVFKSSLKTEGTSDESKKKTFGQQMKTDLFFKDFVPLLSDDNVTEQTGENKIPEKDSKAEFFDETGTLYIPSVCAMASDSAYETPSMPTGFIFTIQIHSTWGDLYYVGLNGVQIFDENGAEIKLHPDNVSAHPEGVNILDGIDNDVRTPDKLIDGVYDTMDGCHMWLAPVLPLTINRVELTFQKPVTLSSMKLWNYSKTPCRGVREFGILVDGLLIYNGELSQAQLITSNNLPKVPCKTINFSNSHRRKSNEDFMKPQNVETSGGMTHTVDQSKRPLTTMTSQS